MSHEILSDKALAEIETEITRRNDATAMESACGEYNCPCHYRIPALCQTVRALRTEHSTLKKHWADTSEDLASAWLKNDELKFTNTALREQLAQHATLLNDGAETEDRCRDLLTAYDKSSPDGIIPLDEVVRIITDQLAQVTQERDGIRNELRRLKEKWAEP